MRKNSDASAVLYKKGEPFGAPDGIPRASESHFHLGMVHAFHALHFLRVALGLLLLNLDNFGFGVCHARLTSDRKGNSRSGRTDEDERYNEQQPVHIHLRVNDDHVNQCETCEGVPSMRGEPPEGNLFRSGGFPLYDYKEGRILCLVFRS
jgi:hypothetical protein